MCGIAGFLNINNSYDSAALKVMLNQIEHRGPDDEGIWNSGRIFLGHRRLSINDLTQSGHQPMHSKSGRYGIVFNGEIYNFEELRGQLNHFQWQGHSDTEVMLQAIESWGLERSLQVFNGMFAFALWDSYEQTLTLARDRFGEKPLYYGEVDGALFFASELVSIEAVCQAKLTIDRNAIYVHSALSYVPAPKSIYQQIKKLTPAHYVTIRKGICGQPVPYWSIEKVIENGLSNRIVDPNDAVEALHESLKKAVKLRMVADVPIGAFLSGGVDSATVVALMQAQSSAAVNTFSIGFREPGYNEAEFAKKVASYLGTKHHERYFSQDDVLELVPKISSIFDEPFSDVSQLPTFLVSAMAKEKVTVALSGDGGDELFCGYKRYKTTEEIWSKISKLPARHLVAKVIGKIPTSALNSLFFLEAKAAKFGRQGKIGPKIKTLASWLNANSIDEFYKASITHWKRKDNLIIGSGFDEELFKNDLTAAPEFGELMMYLDMVNYLPGDILTKVDRVAMSVSLEGRIPLLDHNVAELAWRMPLDIKQKDDVGKWPLKQVMYKYLPKELMDRPKMGFGVPIHEWLRGGLREWAQDLLSYDRIKNQGVYNPVVVHSALDKHMDGSENNAAKLWNVLMVQAWLDGNKKRERSL